MVYVHIARWCTVHTASKVFQVVFVHSVYNSAFHLPPCCRSFLLDVVADLMCQLVLLSALSKISSYLLWSKMVYRNVLLKKRRLYWCQSFLSFSVRVQILVPYERMGTASAICTFILENFRTKVGVKVMFRIPSILAHFASSCWIFFPFPLEISQPKSLKFRTCFTHMLSIHIYWYWETTNDNRLLSHRFSTATPKSVTVWRRKWWWPYAFVCVLVISVCNVSLSLWCVTKC